MSLPAIIQLLGFPGTGKYTVAKEIVRQLEAADQVTKLVDNHATANLILSLVPQPIGRNIPPEVFARINEVRAAVLTTIERLSPSEWSFVFTNFLPALASPSALDRHRQIAQIRRVAFVPVLLRCDREELLRRVTRGDRQGRMKLVDQHRANAILNEGMRVPDWPELWTIDITSIPPEKAAELIIGRACQNRDW